MSKVLWHITMSLDSFVGPRDYSAEWMFEHGGADPMGREIVERTGAILAGRRGYDLGIRAGGLGTATEPRRIRPTATSPTASSAMTKTTVSDHPPRP
jgi:hypothetical protein